MRSTGLIVFASFITFGLILVILGGRLPVYHDYELVRQLLISACDANGVVEGWHQQMATLRTWRHPLMQGGISIILAALTVLSLFAMFGNGRPWGLDTPGSRATYFALGICTLAMSWISQIVSLNIDHRRGVFPWCADTVMIPMFGITVFYLLLLVVCLPIGFIASRFFGPLPTSLGVLKGQMPWRSWGITLACGIAVCLTAYLGLEGASTSAFLGTPAAVIAIYLIGATWAALVQPRDLTADGISGERSSRTA